MSFPQVINDSDSPRDFGFYMPAEWERHDCCWMAWPHQPEYWLDQHALTKETYANVAKAIRQFEPVKMLVTPAAYDEAREYLGPAIELVEMCSDQAWLRDTAPNFLVNGKGMVAGATWQFNSWGGNYEQFANDALIGERILSSLGMANFTSPIYAEGGAVSVDGCGTVLTTESCLLNSNRNPEYQKAEIEAELCRTLGAKKVIWLPGDPDEFETDGHVDGIAAFVKPGVVLMERPASEDSPLYSCFEKNYAALEGQTDAEGRVIDIVFVEAAEEACIVGDKFCTSYINSYLANDGVIMPCYGIDSDERARQVFQSIFPERKIVQVRIDGVAIGGGGIHCITQQQPSARISRSV